jgi:hypothetical protein
MKTPSGTSRARVIKVDDLSAHLIDQMWQLFAQSYDDVTRDQFDRDLAAKNSVFVMFDRGDDSFQGFSTFEIYEHNHESRKIAVLFSGDTMVRPAYWGQTALHLAFARTTVLWLLRHPFTPLYWFLTSMGYRTYLIMARNFPQRYWPRHDAPTPPWIKGLIASLAQRRYGVDWDEGNGVIHFARSQGALASHVAPITAEIRALPEVNFLVAANPDYQQGVELACVARITLPDLVRAALKMARKKLFRGRRLKRISAEASLGGPVRELKP